LRNNVITINSFEIVPLIPVACEIPVAQRIMFSAISFRLSSGAMPGTSHASLFVFWVNK